MRVYLTFIIVFLTQSLAYANFYWLELEAHNKFERSALAEQGFDIVGVEADRVIVIANESSLKKAEQSGKLLARYKNTLSPFDFPQKDERFHNYNELSNELKKLAQNHSQLVTLSSFGKSTEGRDLWSLRLSATLDAGNKAASVFMGGHHAREHVSVEVPLMLAQYLVTQYENKNPRIVALLNNFEVYILPNVNPDGAEYDTTGNQYQYWRKNRSKQSYGNYGVDLNRNYGYGWGGAGASSSPNDETYRGPSAFSEVETQAIKNFVESHQNITTLLSFHTFSELVMWPWGHVDGDITNKKDLTVFQTMGRKMASWNGYKPMKSGDLYLASGDTCDWAYGEHGIFAFTFELDPKGGGFFSGGFYPGENAIDGIFQKNLEPSLYLIETSDNPYKVLTSK